LLDFFILLGQNWSNTFCFELDPVEPWIVETLSTIHFAEQWRWRNAAKKKGKSRLPRTVFSSLMVLLLLLAMTQGGSCGGGEESRPWCSFFFPHWPMLNDSFSFLFLPTLLSVLEKLKWATVCKAQLFCFD